MSHIFQENWASPPIKKTNYTTVTYGCKKRQRTNSVLTEVMKCHDMDDDMCSILLSIQHEHRSVRNEFAFIDITLLCDTTENCYGWENKRKDPVELFFMHYLVTRKMNDKKEKFSGGNDNTMGKVF